MAQTEEYQSKWTAPVMMENGDVHCLPTCVALSTIYNGEGVIKLIIAQKGCDGMYGRLRAFEGLYQHLNKKLEFEPVSVLPSCYDKNTKYAPSIVVATGFSILMFKRLVPYYRFDLIGKEANETEAAMWREVKNTKEGREKLYNALKKRSEESSLANLTLTSQKYLKSTDMDRAVLIKTYGKHLMDQPAITCMERMLKSVCERVDVLVVGTEHCEIMFIDSVCFTALREFLLPSVPVTIRIRGNHDGGYQLIVQTRESMIYSIKRGDTEHKPIIVSNRIITSMVLVGKMIVYSTSENTINFCSFEGETLNTVKCQSKVIMLEPFFHSYKQLQAVIAVFETEIRMYDEHYMLDIVKYEKPIDWVKYGTYGREEGVLIVCFKDGTLSVQLFHSTANFEHKMEYDQIQSADLTEQH